MKCTRIKIVLVACICASINAAEPGPEALMGNLPGYAITIGIQQLNSTRCQKEMEEYRDAVNHRVLWSLKMLDMSGQPSSGFVFGNNYWTGNRQQCAQLSQKRRLPISDKHTRNSSIYRNPAVEFPSFELNFFSAHVRHNSTIQYHTELFVEDIIVLGLCLPASCSENEVATMLTKMFDDRLLLIGQLYSTDFKLIRISDLKDDHTWLLSGKMITILFIFSILLGTVTVGTVHDVLYQKRLRMNKFLFEGNLKGTELNVEENGRQVQEDYAPSEMKPLSRIRQFLIYFSAYSNIKHVFRANGHSEELLALHGLKFFGMIWIILGHTFFFMTNVLNHKAEGFLMTGTVEMQVLYNAPFSVDTFFFVSGFLLSFMYLKFQAKREKVLSIHDSTMNFIASLLRRYIRLTPAYLVTILLVIVYFSWYEKISLYYFDEPVHELCSKYWWRNILYINNFFHWNQMCMTPSWYVANDMQFYTFGLFLLTLSASHYYTALILGILTLFLSTLLHAYIAYATGYIPTFDTQYETITYMYIRPWMRIPPYIVGMGTAMFLAKRHFKLRLSKKVLTACWCLSVLCNCTILFGTSNRNMSLGASVVYEAFGRFVWSLGIAWLVIACATKNGGIVNKFLSLPYWIPFSRLTYCAYLLNEIVVMGTGMYSNYAFNVDEPANILTCFGVCTMIYICALILSVTVELPMTYLQSFITILPVRN